MLFSAVCLVRLTVGMGTSQGLLYMRPLRSVNINVTSLFRSDRAIGVFSKLMTIWKQCLLKLAKKMKDDLLSEVS